jgi:hypothetical protein
MSNPAVLLLSPLWWQSLTPVRTLHGMVDRVEDKVVVVEWSNRSLSDVPGQLFEGEAREGQSACIRARENHSGDWLAMGDVLARPGDPEPCILPSPPFVEPGKHYAVHLQTPCAPPSRFWVLGPF